MSVRCQRLPLWGALFAALLASPAYAHDAGVSTSRIVVNGRTVDVEVNARGRDYEQATGVRITEKGSGWSTRSRSR